MKAKMIEEHPTHYVVDAGQGAFRVAKKGLSDALHAKIRKMADGGTVDALPERRGSAPVVLDQNGQPIPSFGVPQVPAFSNAPDAGTMDLRPPTPTPFEENVARLEGETKRRDALVTAGTKPAPQLPPLKSLSLTSDVKPPTKPNPDDQPSPVAPLPVRSGGASLAVPSAANPELDAATADAIAAERAKSSAEAEGARNLAAAEGENQKRIAQNHLEQTQMLQEARAKSDADMAAIKEASTRMANEDATVDPGRFWASRSTGQKISAIVGLALGSFGEHGVNLAAQQINQAIDRDIDAQKSEHDLRLRKGQASVAAATSMYGLHHQSLQDELAARAAAKATGDEIAASKVKQILAGTQSGVVKSQGEALIANLRADAAKNHQTAGERVFNDTLNGKLKQAETAKTWAEAGKLPAAGPGGVAGLPTPEQGKLFDVKGASQNIRDNLGIARDIIKRKGTFELTGPDQTELERALHFVAQDTARLADPGSTVKDAELENAKHALGVKGGEIFGLSNATAIKLLDSFEAGIDAREKRAFEVRGLKPSSSASEIERKAKAK